MLDQQKKVKELIDGCKGSIITEPLYDKIISDEEISAILGLGPD